MSDETSTAPEQDGTEGGQEPTPTEPQQPQQQDDTAATIARLEQQLAEARKEAAKSRTNAKAAAADQARSELVQQLAQALGIGGEKPPTPEQLAEQLQQSNGALTSAQEEAAAARIELHVYKTAHRLGADAEALLDSRSFAETIDNIDAEDPAEFNKAVETAITEALDRNPQLRAGRAPARGAAEFTGGPNPTTAADKAQPGLDRMRAAYAS